MTASSIDQKKELILNVTRNLISKNGIAKTTLDDIANAIGIKKSSLYYYYKNKEKLLEDVMKSEEERFCNLVAKAFDSKKSPIQRIFIYERIKFDYFSDIIKIFQLTTPILLEFKSKMLAHILKIHEKEIEMLSKLIQEAIESKEIVECDTKRVAKLILTMSEGIRHREIYFSSFKLLSDVDFTEAYKELIFAIELIFNGLKYSTKENPK